MHYRVLYSLLQTDGDEEPEPTQSSLLEWSIVALWKSYKSAWQCIRKAEYCSIISFNAIPD